jgi:uncharacterized protein
MVSVTPFYAGLLALVFVSLSVRVIDKRRKLKVTLGDGGDRALQRLQRVHGNFAEYTPLALLLMTLGELQGASAVVLHTLGIMLVGGRVVHAWGVGREPEASGARVLGMALTFSALGIAALLNLGANAVLQKLGAS